MKLLEKITDFFLGVEDKKETILEEPTIITNEVVKEEIQIKSLDVEKPKRRTRTTKKEVKKTEDGSNKELDKPKRRSTTTKTSEETPKKTRTRKTSTET